MRRTITPFRVLAAIAIATCVAPACADVFGLEEMELKEPVQDASHPADAGDASIEADVSTDGPKDGAGGNGDTGLDGKDVSVEGPDAPTDAKDAHVENAKDTSIDGDDAEPDSGCGLGTKPCSGQCVPTNLATTGCASVSCEPCKLANASSICDANLQCAIGQCVYGYTDCNGAAADGCESQLKSDPNNCGTCGSPCVYANAEPKCMNGVCSMGWCNPGWTDCDGSDANGCEVNTGGDPTNCGSCGNACSFAHATAKCEGGLCTIDSCNSQYANCNGAEGDGCEANLQSDIQHCGLCTIQCDPEGGSEICTKGQCLVSNCPTGFGECDGNPAVACETDLSTSAANCGACGNACQLANATAACVAAECAVASCTVPLGNCDGNDSNGCETNLKSNVLHCGQCGTVCAGAGNATPTCLGGSCGWSCYTGWGDCDADATNGCETDLLVTAAHCGSCTHPCSAFPNADPACAGGVCVPMCKAGFADCDGDSSNGCEKSLLYNVDNCGACAKKCNETNGVASCIQGVCAIACKAGWGNCDGNADNGCEQGLLDDVANCGACGTQCTGVNGTTSCQNGHCVAACAAGYENCDLDPNNGCETSLKTLTDCGACGTPCSFPNATASCSTGTCKFGACGAGWGDCDSSTANGCETSTKTSTANCGVCGTVCGSVNGIASCDNSVCTITCDPGYGNCDSNAANGCETNVTANVQHCGACGTICVFAHGTPECFGGVCQLGACDAGWGNCNGTASDGCETDTNTLTDCGGCGKACSLPNASGSCTAGTCMLVSCSTGFGNCDGQANNGCETDTRASTSHCGACGKPCNSTNGTPSCSLGACSITCSAGFGDCDTNVATGCETSLSTVSDCGACGVICGNANGTTACVAGVCTPTCSPGAANCDNNVTNGCETNTQTDTSNCGTCGIKCLNANGSTLCSAGKCTPTCDSAFGNCDGLANNGCETPLSTATNCGACGVACTNVNGQTACTGGACVPSCDLGFGDCDGNPANGCETNTAGNVNHCGTCTTVCTCGNNETARCTAGSCGCTACTAGTGNCDGNDGNGCETNLTTLTNCGACGVPCTLANATATCSSGTCAVLSCGTGFANCDGTASNGCEINTQTSLSNCGTCGNSCNGSNGTPSCSLGACSITCTAGYGNCDNLFSNGCEASLSTTQNCGACGNVCSNPHGGSTCNNGVCAPTCATGYASCDGNPTNGCEIDLQTDANNCGACGTVCTNAQGTTSCVAGQCVPVCAAGWGDCDGNPNNGCGTDLRTTATNCGSCGNACTNANGSTSCVAGACVPVCSVGFASCDNNASNGCETNMQTNTSHCGSCTTVCGGANGTPVCSLGACSVTCNPGFGNCNSNMADGCETSLTTTSNCGACGAACTNSNGSTSCVSGLCTPVCSAGFGNCDNNPSNGCELQVNTLANCGGCGTTCSRANATATCTTGACAIQSCNPGWGNCDGNDANGCEAPLNTLSNCGQCGTTCSRAQATATCSTGTCAIQGCNSGWGNCDNVDANGCELQLNTTSNCGACGTACTNAHGTTQCNAGVCAPTCATGWGNCDSIAVNGCETDLTTLTNCGTCGTACSLANATSSCTTGICQIATCNAGFGNCDGTASNGCEINLNTDVLHCGNCTRPCGTANVASRVCTAGVCNSVCNLGFGNCNQPASGTDDGCETNTGYDWVNCGNCGNNCQHTGFGQNVFNCGGGNRPANLCGCNSDQDCTPGQCDENTGRCSCGGNTCNQGEDCEYVDWANRCRCNGGSACASGQTCCDTPSGCKNLLTDPGSCGACGHACAPGFNCSAGGCVCNGATSCNAGSTGTCNGSGRCVCGTTTCAAGQRCIAGGTCG